MILSARAGVISLFYASPGAGIILSALSVPIVLAIAGQGSWKITWFVLGGISAVLACMTWLGLRGIKLGQALPHAGEAVFSTAPHIPLLLGYCAFGAGYICYLTFMYAHLRELGAGESALVSFWCTIGVATMISVWLWARLMERLRRAYAFSLLSVIVTVGASIPLISDQIELAFVSAAIFGCALFSVPASTTVFVRRNFTADQWPRAGHSDHLIWRRSDHRGRHSQALLAMLAAPSAMAWRGAACFCSPVPLRYFNVIQRLRSDAVSGTSKLCLLKVFLNRANNSSNSLSLMETSWTSSVRY